MRREERFPLGFRRQRFFKRLYKECGLKWEGKETTMRKDSPSPTTGARGTGTVMSVLRGRGVLAMGGRRGGTGSSLRRRPSM